MSKTVSPFTITAERQGKARSAKRCNAASAMCVADDWAELGWRNIKIIDGMGTVQDRTEFRANLPLVKRLALRQHDTPVNI